jgi:hypothetical protein
MALNLSRNSKVFFTTNVDATTGVVNKGGFTPINTFEVQVLDGFSFSQNTSNETVTVSEAGTTPVRGQRSFNTALEPASFSFSSYLRPAKIGANLVGCEESVLWNAMFGDPDRAPAGQMYTVYTRVTSQPTFTYTAGASNAAATLTVSGFTHGLSANDVVRVVGIASISGSSDTTAVFSSFNSLARVTTVGGGTSVTLTYFVKPTADGATVTTITAPTFAFIKLNATALNSGSAQTLSYDSSLGRLTINGSTMPTFTAGTQVIINNITFSDTTPPTYQAVKDSVAKLNSSAKVVTSTASQLVLEYELRPLSAAELGTATEAFNVVTNTVPVLYFTPWASSSSTTGTTINSFVDNTFGAQTTTIFSNKNQLQKFGMLFLIDQVTYAIDNCVLGEVTVDFGIDAIATAAWSGQGTSVRQVSTDLVATVSDGATFFGAFTGTMTGSDGTTTTTIGNFYPKNTSAPYIANKLSTCSLEIVKSLTNSSGTTISAAGNSYTMPLTGGSITISNNPTYLTPAALATVNQPLTYFTGARSITGTLNAYLKTGTTNATGNLLADMLQAASATVEPVVAVMVDIGGSGNRTRVSFDMPASVVSVPNVDVQQVVSMSLTFNAQGYNAVAASYDIEKNNEIFIRYFAE